MAISNFCTTLCNTACRTTAFCSTALRTTFRTACRAALCSALMAGPAGASAILLDWSPAALGATAADNAYRNVATSQHFAESVTFDTDAFVSGMDIYSAAQYGGLGTPVAITIWADKEGRPGAILGQFMSRLSAIDGDGATDGNVRKHADFLGFTMLADTTYWIGMAGKSVELAQTALLGVAGGNASMAQFGHTGAYFGQSIAGDMAYRLYGVQEVNQVVELPEPGSLPLLGVAGMALLVAQLRRSSRPAV